MKIHVLSDGKQTNEQFVKRVMQAETEIDALHFREYERTAKELYQLIDQCLQAGFPLHKMVVHDRLDVAHAHQIQTVQVGYRSLPIPVIRVRFSEFSIIESVHSIEELHKSEANQCMLSPIFHTSCKKDAIPLAADILQTAKRPYIALGGITPHNVHLVKSERIAIRSGFWEAENGCDILKIYHEMRENYEEL